MLAKILNYVFAPRGPLNTKNYKSGFLVNDLYLGGVALIKDDSLFLAYIVDQTTGAPIDTLQTQSLQDALGWLNLKPYDWKYESTKACGGGKCGSGNKCSTGGCKPQSRKSNSHLGDARVICQ